MSFQIPIENAPHSRIEVTLDEVPYNIVLKWNERAAGWTVSIEDRDGNPILTGRRIVLNRNLFSGYYHLSIPRGSLFAYSKSGTLKDFSKDDLITGRVELIYSPRSEIDGV